MSAERINRLTLRLDDDQLARFRAVDGDSDAERLRRLLDRGEEFATASHFPDEVAPLIEQHAERLLDRLRAHDGNLQKSHRTAVDRLAQSDERTVAAIAALTHEVRDAAQRQQERLSAAAPSLKSQAQAINAASDALQRAARNAMPVLRGLRWRLWLWMVLAALIVGAGAPVAYVAARQYLPPSAATQAQKYRAFVHRFHALPAKSQKQIAQLLNASHG
ncbi:MAG TPA: hypothetical protein VFA48_04135 [Gammaproteobacteria bacterium]|nr:hypothetical protein [Gammaproteobacteria bacterium]